MSSFADIAAKTRAPDRYFDAITDPPVTCTGCDGPGGKSRQWNSPDGSRGAFFCDDCETRVRLGLLRLRALDFVGAVAAIEGWAA
jgi:hypothetical protein